MTPPTAACCAAEQNVQPYTYRAVQPGLFDAIVTQKLPPGAGPQTGRPNAIGRTGRRRIDMFGKLTWEAIPFDQPIPLVASAVVVVVSRRAGRGVVAKGYVPYLWREWITSVDHKRIGVMYCLLALVMLLRGFTDAIMMRSQQALALQCAGLPAAGALRPDLLGARHAS